MDAVEQPRPSHHARLLYGAATTVILTAIFLALLLPLLVAENHGVLDLPHTAVVTVTLYGISLLLAGLTVEGARTAWPTEVRR